MKAFGKLFVAFVLCVAPILVSAITLAVPSNPTPGEESDIFWKNEPRDPPELRLFLVNASVFLTLYQSWGPLDPAPQHLRTTFEASIKPGTNYQLRAVNNTNVDQVLAFSPEFEFKARQNPSPNPPSSSSSSSKVAPSSSSPAASPPTHSSSVAPVSSSPSLSLSSSSSSSSASGSASVTIQAPANASQSSSARGRRSMLPFWLRFLG